MTVECKKEGLQCFLYINYMVRDKVEDTLGSFPLGDTETEENNRCLSLEMYLREGGH